MDYSGWMSQYRLDWRDELGKDLHSVVRSDNSERVIEGNGLHILLVREGV